MTTAWNVYRNAIFLTKIKIKIGKYTAKLTFLWYDNFGCHSKNIKVKCSFYVIIIALWVDQTHRFFQVTTVPKFKNLGEKAIRFDLPWPVKILEDISRGDFAMVEWAPYLDVVIKDQYTKNKRCDFSVSVILLYFQCSVSVGTGG